MSILKKITATFIKIIPIFSFVLFYSCEKESHGPNNEVNLIVFGNKTANNVNATELNPPLKIASSSNGGHVIDSIDIFDDGIYDIAFIAYGQKWANSSFCKIQSIHDSLDLLVEVVDDSVFFTHNNQNPNIYSQKVTWNTFSGFSSYSGNDSLSYTRSVFCIDNFNYGDSLDVSDSTLIWKNEGLFTSYSEGKHYSSEFHQHFRMGFWNSKGEMYLCYRIKNGDQLKYGWVKVSIEYNIIINVFELSIST